jgi:hypothetical protein
VYSAHMLAAALQDARARDELSILHTQVHKYVEQMNHDMGVVKQEVGRRCLQIEAQREVLRQRELALRKTIGQQQISIPSVAGQKLIESIVKQIDPGKLNGGGAITSTAMYNEHPEHTSCENVAVYETDIASDEDQLREEL